MTANAFTWPVTIYYEDTDAAGVVYYANYLKYMERARSEWLALRGHPVTELDATYGIVFVVTHADVAFRAPARLGDHLDTGVEVVELGGALMVVRHDIRRAGATLVTARVTLACVNRQSFKPARIPQPLLESLT